jgi:signal transduction histidine kinase
MKVKGPPERPLDGLPTLKLKLGVVILAAVAVTVLVFWALVRMGVWPSVSGVISAFLALVVVFFISRGMTSPVREMVAATEAMARGDFSQRVTATSHDEIGTLARSFNEMAAELAKTDRVRRDLVANVSHELRTPITALQAVLENIADGVAEPDRETIETMLAQVERLGRLVQQLLDLSRLESGTLALDRRSFEIEPMLDLALRETRLHAGSITLSVEIEPRPFSIEADDERLHQVVANLVANAVRHSPPDGHVLVRAIALADGAQLEVVDEGPGIPAEEATRVFERFYRADSARSSRDGGSGLGLAIAQWIVELHGGDIRVAANEPHGCRMVVRIPGRIELHEPAPSSAPPAASPPAARSRKHAARSSDQSISLSERG